MPNPESRARAFTAARFRNREIFTADGKSGVVTDVLLGDDGKHYAIVDFGKDGVHQAPLSAVAYERNRFVIREPNIRALPAFVAGQKNLRAFDPNLAIDISGYRYSEADDATITVQGGAPQVTVQRAPLTIDWEQAAPQVTVHQPTPHVNVRQLQPEIIVRQPAPRITVELEQPEIVVRMAEPEVDVAIAEPDVQVSVARPQVRVVQPEQPQVRVTAPEPMVSLAPRAAADIAIERNQAQVRYERIGEAQVFVRHAEGGPRLKFEDLSRDEARRLATASPRPVATAIRALSAAHLAGAKVYTINGDEVGEIENVLVGRDSFLYVVMARNSFLGFAAERVLVPARLFAIRGDRVTIPSMAAADIAHLEKWDERMERYAVAPPEQEIPLAPLS